MEIRRWEDASGARLALGLVGHDVVDLLPTFAGTTRTRVSVTRTAEPTVAFASVRDGDEEEEVTQVALEVEEYRFLGEAAHECVASIVALGRSMEVFRDAAAFAE